MSFDQFELHSKLSGNLNRLGFETPTPIQAEAIPVIMQGKDVLGTAQTGTGKTAAFGLPMLHSLLTGPKNRLRALVLAPTRELSEQIFEALCTFGKGSGLRGLTLYGGTSISNQIRTLRQGVDLVVACPGRLLDHVERGTIDLRDVDMLILDEADQMFDMGFMPAIRDIIAQLPEQRQSLMFSATMPNDIRRLAEDILVDPVRISIGEEAPTSTVSHSMYQISHHDKIDLLYALLSEQEAEMASVLVFTRTKHRAERIGDQLRKSGYQATSLQGNMTQGRRRFAMEGFRTGRFQIMVATDIAARGLDVSSVSHVINLDMPETVEAYTHRIGRTGRASQKGDAYNFVTRTDRSLLRSIERKLGSQIQLRDKPPRPEVDESGDPVGSPSASDHASKRQPVHRERRSQTEHNESRPYRKHEAARGERGPHDERTERRPRHDHNDRKPRADRNQRSERRPRPEGDQRSERRPRPESDQRSERRPRPEGNQRSERRSERSETKAFSRAPRREQPDDRKVTSERPSKDTTDRTERPPRRKNKSKKGSKKGNGATPPWFSKGGGGKKRKSANSRKA